MLRGMMTTELILGDEPVPALAGLPRTLEWCGGDDGFLRLLDQTLLPTRVEFRECHDVGAVWEAIRALQVRGAPAIGVAAGFGLCLGMRPHRESAAFAAKLREVADYLCTARPTAVNLAWAVRRVAAVTEAALAGSGGGRAAWAAMLAEAHAIAREDAEVCRRIGEAGADLVPDGGGVLTHCNAGALACSAWGTALSLLYVAHERGRRFRVYADETRPLLQGARLTAFELAAAGIDVTVQCEGAAASLMRAGKVQLVVVGADRIAANGDTANKIGTYPLAIAARHHGIPFYVAAPLSTFDLAIRDGTAIPIEERGEDEIRLGYGGREVVVAGGARCFNPAFDVTPAELLTGIVTQRGRLEPVTAEKVADFFKGGACNGR